MSEVLLAQNDAANNAATTTFTLVGFDNLALADLVANAEFRDLWSFSFAQLFDVADNI